MKPVVGLSLTMSGPFPYYLPLAVLLWRKVMGYDVRVVMATPKSYKQTPGEKPYHTQPDWEKKIEFLKGWVSKFGGKSMVLDEETGLSGVRVVGKLCRYHMCVERDFIGGNRILLVTDVDMLPLPGMRQWMADVFKDDDRVYTFNIEMYRRPDGSRGQFPMPLLSCKASTWSKILKVEDVKSLAESLRRQAASDTFDWWLTRDVVHQFSDELWISPRINKWEAAAPDNKVCCVPRIGGSGGQGGRVDRSDWGRTLNALPIERQLDSHLPRGKPDGQQVWGSHLLPLIKKTSACMKDGELLTSATEYHNEYVSKFKD